MSYGGFDQGLAQVQTRQKNHLELVQHLGCSTKELIAPLKKREYGEPVVVMLCGTRDTPVKGVVSQVP